MLSTYPQVKPSAEPAGDGRPLPFAWIDLLNPEESERAFVENATGLRVPSREALSEIESSSRHYVEGGAIYLSTPLLARAKEPRPDLTPLGVILTPKLLVTVRFDRLSAFEGAAAKAAHEPGLTALDAFARVAEAVVDRIADVLEATGGELDGVSKRAFNVEHRVGAQPGRKNKALQATLQQLGQSGDKLSKVRDTLLGIDRMVQFTAETLHDQIPPDIATRLRAVAQDLASLREHEDHLANKVQFLLDAVLGFINIEQNDIIKVLTVVSVVGVPPTLVASIYGMNFKGMPELNWALGYPYALVLIVLSTLIPLIWFRWRGWL
jgi:magnesium transporter